MKKSIILLLLAALALSLAAAAKDEALESLDNAKKYIQSDNYNKAQEELTFASNKISEILSEQLVKYLPDAPTGFTVDEKNAQGMGQMGALFGSANSIAAVGTYSKQSEDEDSSTLTLTISIGGIMGKTAGLAALGNMFSGYGSGTNSKSVRIAGYSGTQEFDKEEGVAKLTVQVGEKVSVMVEGSNLDSPDVMKALVEKIDLAKLEKAF